MSGDSSKKQCTAPPNNFEGCISESLIIKTIMEYSQDPFYFKDRESRFIIASKVVATRLGIDDVSNIIGKTDFDLFSETHALQAFEDEQKILQTGVPIIGKLEKEVWPDGRFAWVLSSKYPLRDEYGNIIGTWGVSRDITERKLAEEELERLNVQLKEANKKLEELSAVDALSGLYNHRHFYEEAQKEFNLCKRQCEKNTAANFAILLFDIDFFKTINDNYGHLTGDFTIKHIASLLNRTIRATDTAFRYGGDEFAVLLRGINKENAKAVAEKICIAIHETPAIIDGMEISLSISGGVSSFDEAASVNDLLEIADIRLYRSKRSGRNKIT